MGLLKKYGIASCGGIALRLQRFAENDTDAGDSGDDGGIAGKAFTREDVDRIVNRKLETWQSEIEDRLAAARDEGRLMAEETAKMSYEQRLQHERDEAVRRARRREESLAKRENDILRRELRQQALQTMSEKGLPAGLADVLDYSNQEACERSLSTVENAFKKSVQAGLDNRLADARTPSRASRQVDLDTMSDEAYYAATYKH